MWGYISQPRPLAHQLAPQLPKHTEGQHEHTQPTIYCEIVPPLPHKIGNNATSYLTAIPPHTHVHAMCAPSHHCTTRVCHCYPVFINSFRPQFPHKRGGKPEKERDKNGNSNNHTTTATRPLTELRHLSPTTHTIIAVPEVVFGESHSATLD